MNFWDTSMGFLQRLCSCYGEYLVNKHRYAEACIMYERSDDVEAVRKCCEQSLDVATLLRVCHSDTTHSSLAIIADKLKHRRSFTQAAYIYYHYLKVSFFTTLV